MPPSNFNTCFLIELVSLSVGLADFAGDAVALSRCPVSYAKI
jgi:hypothetical protein